MSVVNTILAFFPAYVCCLWFFLFLLRRGKSTSQKLLMLIAFVTTVAYFLEALVLSGMLSGRPFVIAELLMLPLTFIICPIICMYIHALRHLKLKPYMVSLSIVPSLVMSVFAFALVKVTGLDVASGYIRSLLNYDAADVSQYSGVIFEVYQNYFASLYLALEFTLILICVIFATSTLLRNNFQLRDLYDFLAGGKQSSSINIICSLILVFMACLIISFALLLDINVRSVDFYCISMSVQGVTLFFLFYIGILFNERKIAIKDIFLTATITSRDEFLDLKLEDALSFSPEEIVKKDELLIRFRQYMEEEKHYLDPTVSIEKVSSDLGTNRTYISLILSSKICMPFRKYVNSLRISEAKRLMTENPDELLESIASKSGFSSASQLVKKFVEVEGVSPRNWLQNSVQ